MMIEMPFPDMRKLHAHTSGNRFVKATATKNARTLAKYICIDAINRKEARPIAGPVLISYAIFVPSNIARDTSNIIQACKPFVDGIVDSGLVEGDSWQQMKIYNVHVEIDRKNPRVEITLNPVPGNGDMLPK